MRRLLVVMVLAGPTAGSGCAQEEKISLQVREQWSTLFAEQEAKLRFQVKAPQGFAGRAIWTFTAENQRVLPRGRGERLIKAAANQVIEFEVPLAAPPLRAGVVLPARLTVSLLATGNNAAEAAWEKELWIFHPQPFAERTKWLEELKIALWDPDPQGKTAAAFRSLEIPFDEVVNTNALAAIKEGIVVVGEGASFRDEPGLWPTLLQAAQRGVPVLCLAPADGSLHWPAADGNGQLAALSLRRAGVISRFDKRLDVRGWANDGQVAASSLNINSVEGKPAAEISAGSNGWPWLELEYPVEKGRVIVCGFALIKQWEHSPTPRFLLARILADLDEN